MDNVGGPTDGPAAVRRRPPGIIRSIRGDGKRVGDLDVACAPRGGSGKEGKARQWNPVQNRSGYRTWIWGQLRVPDCDDPAAVGRRRLLLNLLSLSPRFPGIIGGGTGGRRRVDFSPHPHPRGVRGALAQSQWRRRRRVDDSAGSHPLSSLSLPTRGKGKEA